MNSPIQYPDNADDTMKTLIDQLNATVIQSAPATSSASQASSPSGGVIYDSLSAGVQFPQSRVNLPTLSLSRDGGYVFNLYAMNASGVSQRYRILFNNDTTLTNYEEYSASGLYDPLFYSDITNGYSISVNGFINILPYRSQMIVEVNYTGGYITNSNNNFSSIFTGSIIYLVPVNDVTQISFASSASNGFSNGRIRLWVQS
jgi:hypothetical protein